MTICLSYAGEPVSCAQRSDDTDAGRNDRQDLEDNELAV